MCVGCATQHTCVCLAPLGPLQAAFKPAYGMAGLSLTRITYLSKLIGIPSLAAFLKLELFRVYKSNTAVIVIRQILLDKMLAILT
ncbi:hypothetical protein PEC311524_07850 [Pectobacterium carotovorum subsp. carotovorum]|nr:hypothetical protein PEC311524_07850 [Pectobacterium carotovorum subsp. carotovorum]